MQTTLALADDALFAEHRAPEAHPERPERLDAARRGVGEARIATRIVREPPRDASDDELARVHTEPHLRSLGRMAGKSGYLDPDTFVAPQSVAAARRAAGGAIAMTEALLGGRAQLGVALLRPPGHHARPEAAMGFCLLNNAAVAAAHARSLGAERVAIVDWDVHHGNGTQEMFYADPSVLYVSLHQYPHYPGTGAVTETGEAAGEGFTVNVPLSSGAHDGVYAAAFERLVSPILSSFDPDLLLISAGFDAHARDPLAGMRVTEEGFAAMAAQLARALPRGAAGRIGIVLEGGYDLTALAGSFTATLEVLAGARRAVPSTSEPSERHASELDRAVEIQRRYWNDL